MKVHLSATRGVARAAALLAAASLLVCVAPVRAQGVGPNVVIPNTRPHTSLQIMGTMQVPWTVAIHPSGNSIAIGNCQAVYIDLFDPRAKDVPRNPTGQRVSIADFDWTATGNAAVGKYEGPNAWKVCACPAAAVGSTIHVMATYPAAMLPDKAKVPGLAFQSYIELPVAKAMGGNVPPGCDDVLVTTTVAISVPGGGAPSGTPATVAPPTSTAPPATTVPSGRPPVIGEPIAVAPGTGRQPGQVQPAVVPATPTVAAGASPPSGTAYPPGGSTGTPPANAPPPTNAPASNRYRVVATGFRVLHQTKDDFFSRDGHGDEVYGGFMTFHYDRGTSKLVDQNLRRTNVIGEHGFDGLGFGDRLVQGVGTILDKVTGVDIAVKNSRIKGGTATQNGGFAQNDVFPAVADPSKSYGAAPTDNTFPFLVWEGPLTDGKDAVVILPSLWEFDGFPDGFNKWHQSEQTNVLQIWSDQGVQAAVAGTQLAMLSPPGTLETSFGLHYTASTAFEFAFAGALGPITALTAGSYDRPIGVKMNGVAGTGGLASGPSMPRRALVITREIMEATLAKLATYNPATTAPGVFPIYGAPPVILPAPPPGTIAVQLFESPAEDLQGMYILYLQVQRLP